MKQAQAIATMYEYKVSQIDNNLKIGKVYFDGDNQVELIDIDQDWEKGITTYTFNDNSQLIAQEQDLTVL